jgi:hypothetical protein
VGRLTIGPERPSRPRFGGQSIATTHDVELDFIQLAERDDVLGRKLNGKFQGDLVTDQLDFSQLPRRLPGRRVKHRMKRNWIKMYNKEGSVLRVETRIASPRAVAHGGCAQVT